MPAVTSLTVLKVWFDLNSSNPFSDHYTFKVCGRVLQKQMHCLLADDVKISSLFELSSCGWKPFFPLWTRLTAPETHKKTHKCFSCFVRQECAVAITDAESAAWPEQRRRRQASQDHSSPVTCCWMMREFLERNFLLLCKKYFKSLFGACVDISDIRGSRINPSALVLCIVVCQSPSQSGPQGSGGHGEFRGQALFWCFVWALCKREGILVFSVTDRPLCLRKHNETSDWAPCCSQMSPSGPPHGPLLLLRFVEKSFTVCVFVNSYKPFPLVTDFLPGLCLNFFLF